eukprot:939373-Prymnesium_polylepis.2
MTPLMPSAARRRRSELGPILRSVREHEQRGGFSRLEGSASPPRMRPRRLPTRPSGRGSNGHRCRG